MHHGLTETCRRKFSKDDGNETDAVMQFCWAHLIRDVKLLTTLSDLATRRYGEKLLAETKNLFRLWHRRSEMSKEKWELAAERAKQAVVHRARRAPQRTEAQNIAERFRNHATYYFTFLHVPGVEPTNNAMEQRMRFLAVDRKITHGTRGERGRRWCERMWAVLAPLFPHPFPAMLRSAVYGGRTKVVDVTEKVQQAYARDKFAPIQADHRVFGDPIPGNQKELDLLFRYNVRRVSLRLSPQQVVVLPPVAPGGTRVPDASREFRIVAARYGAGLTWIDVTEPLKTALEDPTKPLKLDGRWAGKDPWHGIQKRFAVWFDYRGRRFVRLVPADESVIFLPGK
jgi:hypothetical protein